MRYCLAVLIVVVIVNVCTCRGESDDNEISSDTDVPEELQGKKISAFD